jgi:hypothetical protein
MPKKVEKFQRLPMDSGHRDRRFRDRDRRFRELTRNRSRSNGISGHHRPEWAVTIKRNEWSRSRGIRTTASDFSYRSVRLGYLALNNPNILRRLIVRNQSANALQQPGISVAAL